MVERRSPKPSAEVRFLVGPLTNYPNSVYSCPDEEELANAIPMERCLPIQQRIHAGAWLTRRGCSNCRKPDEC